MTWKESTESGATMVLGFDCKLSSMSYDINACMFLRL